MYIYQDGNLYIRNGEQLVGVDVYSDKVVPVKGTETIEGSMYSFLTPYEVKCKFQIDNTPYLFPRPTKKVEPVKEVVEDGATKPVKRTTRKSTSK